MHGRYDQSERVRVMGRLSPLRLLALAACAIGVVACDRSGGTGEPPPAPTARSEAVTAASNMPTAVSAAPPAASGSAAQVAPKAPRNLCEKDLAQPGRPLPKMTFTAVAAPGVEPPMDRIATGGGRWTWINFFAAWCGPCKEEMPRLRGFQQKLAANLDVAFVSLDDDERQLRQLLESQGASGVRGALWLQPGKGRTTWLTALRLKDPPELPAHVLVDPSGKVRCVVGGAVDEADLPAIAAIVKR
jgi:thiol-disulfide isomerase/thioredoxin